MGVAFWIEKWTHFLNQSVGTHCGCPQFAAKNRVHFETHFWGPRNLTFRKTVFDIISPMCRSNLIVASLHTAKWLRSNLFHQHVHVLDTKQRRYRICGGLSRFWLLLISFCCSHRVFQVIIHVSKSGICNRFEICSLSFLLCHRGPTSYVRNMYSTVHISGLVRIMHQFSCMMASLVYIQWYGKSKAPLLIECNGIDHEIRLKSTRFDACS